ncbi:hypothetical protein B0T17DRAFT_222705 [Bombardia bombarda]|uniref:Uncharacterized protein n=1 Tax=Bombardia bombarda TaxID=252184 RepID=A0AA39XB80_9PEZI|nr:hypothetical protein B0T17DRAFT_222705 [Bombardia bombarda]
MSTNPSPGNQGQPNMPTTPGSRRSEDAAVSITSDHETTIDPTQALPNQAEMTNESNERNSRQSVTNILIQINDYLTATKHVDESAEFRGARSAYPVTPAEAFLNDKLHETKERYSQLQALEKNTSGSVTPSQLPPSREGRSRSPSFAGSMASTSGPDISHHRGGSMSSRGPSPLRPQGATEIQQRRHAKTLPGVSTPSSAAVTTANPPASSSSLPAQRSGDNTHLEVPSPSYRGAR